MTPRTLAIARRMALPLAVILLVLSAGAVFAADEALGGKLRTGETITIAAGETVEGDVYAAAGSVTVDGTINGDLVATGGEVRINGTVSGDLIAAGGTLTVTGSVDGDARLVGGQITVSGDIGEDLLVAGGRATLEASSSVGEDVIATAGQLVIAGSVAGSVEGGAGTYERTGTVGGTENVVISEQAAAIDDDRDDNPIIDGLRHYVVVVLVGALALWLLPGWTRGAAERIRNRPLASLGSGLLAALGWILAVIGVIVVIVVGALIFGLVGLGELAVFIGLAGLLLLLVASFALYLVVSYLAEALVGLALAGLLRREAGSRWVEIGLLAAGAAVVVLLTSLPVVGGWIRLVVVILALGGLALAAWDGWRARRAARSTTPLVSEV
ncbi:MAG: hypothetical protein ACR2F5_00380 [Candidatus Limnocylindria bacterium]